MMACKESFMVSVVLYQKAFFLQAFVITRAIHSYRNATQGNSSQSSSTKAHISIV